MRTELKYQISDICTAFNEKTIGSKVIDRGAFFLRLHDAINEYEDKVQKGDIILDAPGQYCVLLPEAMEFVSAGDGLRTQNPEDYIIRSHREGPKMFLRREFSGKVNSLKVIVYTREAYLIDPDITPKEAKKIQPDTTHVIVAVLASSGPESELSPFRFVHNLAGGNNAYKHLSGDDIRAKAVSVLAYANEYTAVAD